jgi:succinate dehydrogenase / fumarate reductase iron-sulfur subunit
MNQIMRLRRVAGDHHIVDRNNGHRHESAFVTLIRDYGLLHEAELLPRSYGGDSWFGKFHPEAGKELLDSFPVVVKGLMRRKMNPKIALFGHKLPKQDLNAVKAIYDVVNAKDSRDELNLYISGYDEDDAPSGDDRGTAMASTGAGDGAGNAPDAGQPGMDAEDSPTR